MTAHELARKLLADQDAPIQAWDPDSGEWEEVTGYTYGNGLPTRIYTDDIS
jgi:hypothetical protein